MMANLDEGLSIANLLFDASKNPGALRLRSQVQAKAMCSSFNFGLQNSSAVLYKR